MYMEVGEETLGIVIINRHVKSLTKLWNNLGLHTYVPTTGNTDYETLTETELSGIYTDFFILSE